MNIEENEVFKINIDNYSGPLDVLLELAKTQKVDLANISITQLADQFISFIDSAKQLNLDLASEYLLMATWLTYLKSKLLLPMNDDDDDFKASEVAERLDCSAEEARMRVAHLLGQRLCESLSRVGPRPDARAAIEAILQSGRKIGVVSDYGVRDKLKALGLLDLPWSTLQAADGLGALKPSPRVFRAAVSDLDCAPAEVTHIGDRSDTDVTGAEGAGLRAVLLGAGGAASLREASAQVLKGGEHP